MGAELRFPPTPGMKILDVSWDPGTSGGGSRKNSKQEMGYSGHMC